MLYEPRRIHPICPKCKKHNTYDIIPGIPNITHLQLSKDVFEQKSELVIGNKRYHCLDCDYSWKKYRGKKIYDQIKIVYANSGGFEGPNFKVKIDFESNIIERTSSIYDDSFELVALESIETLTREESEWFQSELHKCDLVNWAEEYFAFACDGTNWIVRMEYENYCEIIQGSNHFPSKWGKFCKAVSKVSGDKFY